MRILHIASIGLNAEGIGTVISKIVPKQVWMGHDVRIVSTCDNLIYRDLKITTVSSREEFSKYLDSWSPEIVQFHSVYRFLFIGYYKILLKRSIPYIIQMHGALSEENYQKNHLKKYIANKLFFYRYLKKAKAVLFLNNEEMNKCAVRDIVNNPTILPNGCDAIDNISISNTCQTPIDIIYVGRVFMVHKGLDVLCDALEILYSKNVAHFNLTFYANPDDDDLAILKDRISRLGANISYKGGIYGADKDKRLRKADIFILTSRFEGMPMGLLEALSYGIPAIVTLGTNMGDIINEANAGWLADFTPIGVANTIMSAIKDYTKSPKKYKENAYRLGKRFDWEEIARQSIDIYRKYL